MNREKLRCLLACLCIMSGIFFTLFGILSIPVTSPSYFATLILSGALFIAGIVSLIVCWHNHKIIAKLKSGKLHLLARWTYHAKDFEEVRYQLENDRYVSLSIIVLLALCGVLILFATYFNTTTPNLTLGCLGAGILLIICSLSFWAIWKYYRCKLNTEHETLISDDYIYFKSELYSMQKSFYYLQSVDIIHLKQDYLQFMYSAPGTPYGPFHILTVPIPAQDLPVAYEIREHFSARLQYDTTLFK